MWVSREESYLLGDSASALDQLPLGEAVRRAHLQCPGLLHQENAAVTQLLDTGLDLTAHLRRGERERKTESERKGKKTG